jgi:F-type H+-transporting ATPase subunit b
MIQIPNLVLSIEKSGGLFDFDGTLPIIAIQFLILTFSLNIILYTPLLKIINERNQYINKNLAQASIILNQADKLNEQYEVELLKARKEILVEISRLQKSYKNLVENEIQSSQKILESYLEQITNNLKIEQSKILESLEKEIDSLSNEIMIRITA